MGISYGRAPVRRAGGGRPLSRSAVHCHSGGGRRTLSACRGRRPRQQHAGALNLSVDDATRARTAMRLYGRQSRVRARRRRVLLSLGVVLALLAIPLGHLVLQRGAVVHGVRVAGVPLGGASRAQAEREITAAVGDQLQRDVTVNVAGRSATFSPYDLGVRVDAARTAQAALDSGRVRGGLLFSLAYSRAIAPVLRYPDATRAAGGARERDAGSGRRAPGAQAERGRHRRTRQGRCRLRSRRGPAGDHERRARRSQRRVAAHRAHARCDLDGGRAARQGPGRAAAVRADRLHAPRPGCRSLARAAARRRCSPRRPTST